MLKSLEQNVQFCFMGAGLVGQIETFTQQNKLETGKFALNKYKNLSLVGKRN